MCHLSHILGAYAEDWTRWRSLLCNLYDALIREISHIGSRGKYVTGTRHIAVKDNLTELTADICHQVTRTDGCSSMQTEKHNLFLTRLYDLK